MDAVKYLRERERMCGSYIDCIGCPLDNIGCALDNQRVRIEESYPEKAVAIVEKWSKEHKCDGCFGASFDDCASCPIPDVNCYEQCKEQNNE